MHRPASKAVPGRARPYPVAAGRILIGSAGAIVQFGTLEREERHARPGLALEQARRGKIRSCREARDFTASGQLREHEPVARQQNPWIESERLERDGESRADIAQATGLHQRGAFRRGEQDTQLAGFHGCVTSGEGCESGLLRAMNARMARPMLAGVRTLKLAFAPAACAPAGRR